MTDDDDIFPPPSSKCTDAIYDSGFIKVDLPPGKVLTLYKEYDGDYFSIYEIRVSQMPNLLEYASVVIPTYPASDS